MKRDSKKMQPISLREEPSFLALLENGAKPKKRKPAPQQTSFRGIPVFRARGLEDVAPAVAPSESAPPPPPPQPLAVLAAATVVTWDADVDAPSAPPPADVTPAPAPAPVVTTTPPVDTAPVAPPKPDTAASPPPTAVVQPAAQSARVVEAGTYRVGRGGAMPSDYDIAQDINSINDPYAEQRERNTRQLEVDTFLRQMSARPLPAPARAASRDPYDVIDVIADTEELSRATTSKKKAPAKMTSSQSPTIRTTTPTDADPDNKALDRGCGGFLWRVFFELPTAAANDGWIVQEIDVTFDVKDSSGSVLLSEHKHFWEAWELKKGKTITTRQDGGLKYDDMYSSGPGWPTGKGSVVARGIARFYEGALPADFKTFNPDTFAGTLPSTINKPAFWDGSGTQHDVSATFDCTTTPNTHSVTPIADGVTVPVK